MFPAMLGALWEQGTVQANPSYDGFLGTATSSASWAAHQGAASGGEVDVAGTVTVQIVSDTISTKWDRFRRGGLIFAPSIPTGATVTAARLLLYITTVVANYSGKIAVCSFLPGVDASWFIADYSTFGTTDFITPIALGSLTTSAYNEWTLNAAGLAAVAATTRLGVRIESDMDNAEPTWASNQQDGIIYQSSDGANPPILQIDYEITP